MYTGSALEVSLTLSRISLHLAAHARYLLVRCCRFTSAIARFHSAGVYGSTGSEAGVDWDNRFAGFCLKMGVEPVLAER